MLSKRHVPRYLLASYCDTLTIGIDAGEAHALSPFRDPPDMISLRYYKELNVDRLAKTGVVWAGLFDWANHKATSDFLDQTAKLTEEYDKASERKSDVSLVCIGIL